MKALQYREVGAAPEVVTVLDPGPGPGQVLLKVPPLGRATPTSPCWAGPAEGFPYALPLTLTLGHE
jgi:propanol-preferring alcohol dehydrogenase